MQLYVSIERLEGKLSFKDTDRSSNHPFQYIRTTRCSPRSPRRIPQLNFDYQSRLSGRLPPAWVSFYRRSKFDPRPVTKLIKTDGQNWYIYIYLCTPCVLFPDHRQEDPIKPSTTNWTEEGGGTVTNPPSLPPLSSLSFNAEGGRSKKFRRCAARDTVARPEVARVWFR